MRSQGEWLDGGSYYLAKNVQGDYPSSLGPGWSEGQGAVVGWVVGGEGFCSLHRREGWCFLSYVYPSPHVYAVLYAKGMRVC